MILGKRGPEAVRFVVVMRVGALTFVLRTASKSSEMTPTLYIQYLIRDSLNLGHIIPHWC